MREDWEIMALKNVCKKITDGSHNPPKGIEYSDFIMLSSKNVDNDGIHYENPRFLKEEDFNQENKRTQVEHNDVLLTIVGTIGRVAVVPKEHKPFTLQRSVAVLKVDKEVIFSRFLMFSLQNILDFLTSESRGVAQKGIYLKQLRELEIPIPPLPEQKQIVDILDKAFTAIDQAKANIEKNIENAKELFQSKLNEIFSQKGDGWEEKTFGSVCHFVRGPFGGSLKKSNFKNSGNAVYEQQHAINDQFDSIRYFIDDLKFEEMKRFELKSGDLIMSCSGTMGKVAIVPESIKKGIINQALLKLTPNNLINREYLKRWMESTHFFDEIAKNSKGAAIKNVASVKILKQILVPLPSRKEQIEIINSIDELQTTTDNLLDLLKKKNLNLDELKKSILLKAFTGELTSADALSITKEVSA